MRTYPAPANKGAEVSCTAAITDQGEWLRLFPIPYRLLDPDKKYHKYQWIEASMIKASNDVRPESYHPDLSSIRVVSAIDTRSDWQLRKNIVLPLASPSMCAIQAVRDNQGFPTLGVFKPQHITRLAITPDDEDWSQEERAKLAQLDMFSNAPEEPLEKIPHKFVYHFTCAEPGCHGHEMSCVDWEMAETYRSWRDRYGDDWEKPFRQRWERDMIEKNDTYLFVGTIHQHPGRFIIVGVFYPPNPPQGRLPGFP